LREVAEKAGYEVRGFAPTTRAAQQLAESGIQTETLQKFIRRRREAPAGNNRLLVLDESSLASTKNLHKFFARLQSLDKVLLVGDTRQHQAVEAGTPFEQFQKHGMATVKLSEIVRQRDPELKRTVERLSAREISQALDSLESRGRVIEIADEKQRLKAIAKAYCESPENTLVVSPANRDRVKINSLIHQRLQREGKISQDDHQMTVYVNRQDMTGTERTFANSYLPGEDIIRYNRASKVYQVEVGDYGRVTAANHEKNKITVSLKDGRELTYSPSRLSGVSVYKEAQRDIAEGDRIQFRAPFTERRVANGELGTIATINDEELIVTLDSGREISFETEKYRHIDHGYAVTSHSSQGQTVDRVLINADTRESELLLNDRMGYVAVSRAREDAIIFTNSLQELREALDRRVDKNMALDAMRYGPDQTGPLREESAHDSSLHHEQSRAERRSDQAITNDHGQLNATNDVAQTEEMEFDLA
jgi:ATP-dependent exoDNAse (exonuclease V) alpha subunit